MDVDLGGLLDFAVTMAEQAGRKTLEHFGAEVPTELKADSTPVTQADRDAEQLCREMLETRFPADGILGEEFGTVRPAAPRRWILDPIDGTKSFIRGVPLYGVLIALEEAGLPPSASSTSRRWRKRLRRRAAAAAGGTEAGLEYPESMP